MTPGQYVNGTLRLVSLVPKTALVVKFKVEEAKFGKAAGALLLGFAF